MSLFTCRPLKQGRAECSYYKMQSLFVRYTSKLHMSLDANQYRVPPSSISMKASMRLLMCSLPLCDSACTSMSVCKNSSDKLKLINYLFRENKTPCEIVALHAAHIFLLILHPAQKHNLTISFISPAIVSSVSCAFMHCLPLSQLYCSTLF